MVRGILELERQPVVRRPGDAAKGRDIAAEPAVGGGLAAFVEDLFGAGAEAAEPVVAGQTAPAEAAGDLQAGGDRLGGDDVLTAVDPGADEILQTHDHRGAPVAFGQQLEAQIEAAVVIDPVHRGAVIEAADAGIAEGAHEPRCDLEADGAAVGGAHATVSQPQRRIGRHVGVGHVHEPGQAIEIVTRHRLRMGSPRQRRRPGQKCRDTCPSCHHVLVSLSCFPQS